MSTIAVLLKKAKTASFNTKHTVNGFIRQQQLINAISTKIPIMINYFILSYYDSTDKWNIKQTDNTIKIDKELIHSSGSKKKIAATAYLTNIIQFDKYSWKFKIINLPKFAVFGICNVNQKFKLESLIAHDIGYSFNVCNLKLTGGGINDFRCSANRYGIKCKNNDIIEMILDMNDSTLSFVINAQKFGPAFDNIKKNCQYTAAVIICATPNKPGCIELLNSGHC